jgi:hypothetical protein
LRSVLERQDVRDQPNRVLFHEREEPFRKAPVIQAVTNISRPSLVEVMEEPGRGV